MWLCSTGCVTAFPRGCGEDSCVPESIGNGTVYFGEIKNILVDEGIPDATRGKVDVSWLNPAIYAPITKYEVISFISFSDVLGCR